jgi:hypothetical protein
MTHDGANAKFITKETDYSVYSIKLQQSPENGKTTLIKRKENFPFI